MTSRCVTLNVPKSGSAFPALKAEAEIQVQGFCFHALLSVFSILVSIFLISFFFPSSSFRVFDSCYFLRLLLYCNSQLLLHSYITGRHKLWRTFPLSDTHTHRYTLSHTLAIQYSYSVFQWWTSGVHLSSLSSVLCSSADPLAKMSLGSLFFILLIHEIQGIGYITDWPRYRVTTNSARL